LLIFQIATQRTSLEDDVRSLVARVADKVVRSAKTVGHTTIGRLELSVTATVHTEGAESLEQSWVLPPWLNDTVKPPRSRVEMSSIQLRLNDPGKTVLVVHDHKALHVTASGRHRDLPIEPTEHFIEELLQAHKELLAILADVVDL